MLQPIKDNPNLLKDTESKAVLAKPLDDRNSVQIRNLKKKVQELETSIQWRDETIKSLKREMQEMEKTIVGLNERIEQLEKLHYDKSN